MDKNCWLDEKEKKDSTKKIQRKVNEDGKWKFELKERMNRNRRIRNVKKFGHQMSKWCESSEINAISQWT